MAEPDANIWKRIEKNGLVYYRAFSDNGIPYYWSGKDSNRSRIVLIQETAMIVFNWKPLFQKGKTQNVNLKFYTGFVETI